MSINSTSIDMFPGPVDHIDIRPGCADICPVYRQVASIGRSDRQMSDPGPN